MGMDAQGLQATWKPVEFTVDRVCLLSRAGFIDPFRVRYEAPLGDAADEGAEEVNVPYVATVGPCSTDAALVRAQVSCRVLLARVLQTLCASQTKIVVNNAVRLGMDTCTCAAVQAARYGIGSMQEGVWYYAYGANMSSEKLTGSRNITSLESVPGRLDGWRLAFNHRHAA